MHVEDLKHSLNKMCKKKNRSKAIDKLSKAIDNSATEEFLLEAINKSKTRDRQVTPRDARNYNAPFISKPPEPKRSRKREMRLPSADESPQDMA